MSYRSGEREVRAEANKKRLRAFDGRGSRCTPPTLYTNQVVCLRVAGACGSTATGGHGVSASRGTRDSSLFPFTSIFYLPLTSTAHLGWTPTMSQLDSDVVDFLRDFKQAVGMKRAYGALRSAAQRSVRPARVADVVLAPGGLTRAAAVTAPGCSHAHPPCTSVPTTHLTPLLRRTLPPTQTLPATRSAVGGT